MKDEAIYHATLAFSQYHLTCSSSEVCSINNATDHTTATGEHSAVALRQLRLQLRAAHEWTGLEGLSRSINALACILQLALLEAHKSSSRSWSLHLQAADALLPSFVDARTGHLHEVSKDLDGNKTEDCIFSDNETVIELLLASFLWLDILARVSTRENTLSQLNHTLLLEQTNIRPENLFGCRCWAVLMMLKISQLDDWKREAEMNRRLSVADLVKRGAKIEEELEQGLADELVPQSRHERTGLELEFEEKCLVVTRCYGLAALTYLHVVVSGAHPDLPEIYDSVSRGLAALMSLKEQNMFETAVWPVCVIGCMVAESKESTFRIHTAEGGVTLASARGLSRAMEIVEHCWKQRAAGFGNCDWFSAMKSVGQQNLLL